MRVSMVLDQGTHAKSGSYGLSGYSRFTRRGNQDRRDLVPHDRLLTKIAATGVDLSVVVRVQEFLLGHSQRVRLDGQLSEEVRVTSGMPQKSVLDPLLFLACVNDIWRNIESNTRLFADYCIIYRKIMD